MRKLTKRCPECGELMRKYKTNIVQSNRSRLDYFRCNTGHQWRYLNGEFDRKVDIARGVRIVAARNETARFPVIPGARNIMGRCWSGSE
jgi:uncharacterized C2H2 Zn-finger protein